MFPLHHLSNSLLWFLDVAEVVVMATPVISEVDMVLIVTDRAFLIRDPESISIAGGTSLRCTGRNLVALNRRN